MSYTKLFASIITSTLWSEDDRTRIVWITLMACADKNGEFQGSIPGLARIAGVPVEDCRNAIAKFLSPDPDSRTKDDEGRRIEEIPGGWALLNYRKYRDMASDEDRKRAAAERQQRVRDRKSRNSHAESRTSHAPVTGESLQKSQAEAEAEAKKDTPPLPPGGSPPSAARSQEQTLPGVTVDKKPDQNSVPEGFDEFWECYPKKVAKQDAMKAFRKIPPAVQLTILNDIAARCQSEQWTKSNGQFIPYPATYLRGRLWEDQGVDPTRLVPDIEDICELPIEEIKRRMASE